MAGKLSPLPLKIECTTEVSFSQRIEFIVPKPVNSYRFGTTPISCPATDFFKENKVMATIKRIIAFNSIAIFSQ